MGCITLLNNCVFQNLACIIQLQSETLGLIFHSEITKNFETLKSVESQINQICARVLTLNIPPDIADYVWEPTITYYC